MWRGQREYMQSGNIALFFNYLEHLQRATTQDEILTAEWPSQLGTASLCHWPTWCRPTAAWRSRGRTVQTASHQASFSYSHCLVSNLPIAETNAGPPHRDHPLRGSTSHLHSVPDGPALEPAICGGQPFYHHTCECVLPAHRVSGSATL